MNRTLLVIFAMALVVRLAVIALPGYIYDIYAYEQWASLIADRGPLSIYAPSTYPRVDYPPGYLYALWAVGIVHRFAGGGELGYRIAVKSVAVIADLVLIGLVYRASRAMASERAALWLTAAVALLPPLWLDSALYGQTDSVPIVFAFSAMLVMLAGNGAAGIPLLAASILIKPQALLIVPGLAALLGRLRQNALGIAGGVAGAAVLAYLAVLPFTTLRAPGAVFAFLYRLYAYGAGKAPYTTDGAFNLYAVISSFFSSDMRRIGPISYHELGLVLVIAIALGNAALLAWAFLKFPDENRRFVRSFGTATLSLLALFLFATRMHERYLLPALVFGAPLALDDVPSAAALLWLGATFCANLGFIMAGFYGGAHHPITLRVAQGASLGNVAAFCVLWQRQWRRLFVGVPVSGRADCR